MDDHRGRAEDALKLKMLMEQQEILHDRNGGPTNAYSVPLNLSSQGVNFVRPMPLYAWTHQPTWTSTMPGKCSPHGGSSAPPMLQNVCGQAATNASRHQQLGTAPLQPAMPRSNSSEMSDADLVFEFIDEKLDEMRHERFVSFRDPNASVVQKRQDAIRIIFCEKYMNL